MFSVGVLFMLVGLVPTVAWSRLALRLLAPDAMELLAKDPRAPVLYLRTFTDDPTVYEEQVDDTLESGEFAIEAKVFSRLYGCRRAEERLVAPLKYLGPVVAIGRPGENLPELGAARFYVPDDQWQESVLSLMRRARLVIFLAGSGSPGTMWEVSQAVAEVSPRRLIFFLPFAFGEGTYSSRQIAYDAFRDAVGDRLPRPLPEAIGSALFIRFDDGWTPYLVEPTLDGIRRKPGGAGAFWLAFRHVMQYTLSLSEYRPMRDGLERRSRLWILLAILLLAIMLAGVMYFRSPDQ